MKPGKLTLIAAVLCTTALLGMLATLTRFQRSESVAEPGLPQLGKLAHFELTDTDGTRFGLDQLRGKIWIADFIFTSCAGTCPVLSENMRALHRELAERPDVRFVSVSVDPDTDTPEVLGAYAKRYSADTTRWHFLTGPEAAIQDLAVNGFKVGSVDDPIVHSNRFVLVDGDANIRGYYLGTEPEDVARLNMDLERLVSESAS